MFSRMLKLPGGRPSALRRVVDGGHHPCRHAVPGAGQGGDHRLVRPDPRRVLRRRRGQHSFTWCDSEQWLAHPGTVGAPVLGKLLILDNNSNEVPTGETGTVWFEGATNFSGYHDEAKTIESRDESGQRSTVGDVGYVDDDGYLYLTDRKTYMIISGRRRNACPQEAENLLVTHDKVLDTAVIGVPNEDLGEEVKAVVQPMPGVDAGSRARRRAARVCAVHLARFKCPRSIDFQDELPSPCPPASSTSVCSRGPLLGRQHIPHRLISAATSATTSRRDLAAIGRSRRYPAGRVLFAQGESSDHVVLITSGRVKVFCTTEDGREPLLGMRGGAGRRRRTGGARRGRAAPSGRCSLPPSR